MSVRRILFVLMIALTVSGCVPRGPSPNMEGAARTVLVSANEIDAASLDPAVAYEFTSANICMNLYQTLIRYVGNDFVHPLPSVAKSWTASPDGLQWTFTLQEGLRFASGRPLDAEAVRFSLVRAMQMDQAPAWILKDSLAPERVEVIDPHTVRLRLEKPSAYFLSTLFNSVASIVDPTEVQSHDPSWMRDHSAGSGPYVLTSWERDVAIVLERNPNYSGPPAPLHRVIIKDVKEPTMQGMMLDKGDVDIAYDTTPLQAQSLSQNPRVELMPAPLLRVWYVGMNVTKKPLDDVRVRQAIRCAIDYDGILKYLVQGHGIRLEGPIIQGLPGFAPHLGVYDYNPQKARALLAEAGLPNGFDITFTSFSGSTELGPTVEDLCVKIQRDLAQVGIRAEVKNLSSGAYLDLFRAHNLELNLGYWSADYPDSHNFMHPFGHSQGSLAKRVNYSNPRLDPLIDAASRELNVERRSALYLQAEKILAEDGPWAILVQPQRPLPIRRELRGFVWNPLSSMEFWTCTK